MNELPLDSDEELQNLTPLQNMLLTAKRVAQSTGEAAERLNHDRPLRNHGVKFGNECLTPLQRAQLTAKQVAQSTGQAVERLGSKLEGGRWSQPSGAEMKLQSKSNDCRHQHSTPKWHIVLDPHKHEPVEQTDISISPLQRVEITAQRVAKSTSKSLDKLNICEDATNSTPPHKRNGYLHESKDLLASGAKKSRHINLPLTNSIHIYSSSLASNALNTQSEHSASDYSGRSSSSESKYACLGHGNPENQEGISSKFEKVQHTARMVAESTGEAVQKLSNSLSDDI